jgi:hypothetical protein
VTGTDASTESDPGARRGPEPEPEPIRFFGTTWVHRDGGYGWRRAGLAAGALAAAALGAAAVGYSLAGVLAATSGPAMPFLVVIGFGACSVLAFHHTWASFTRRRRPQGVDPEAARGLYALGFIGIALAYFVRALYEAPGERLHRAEYEERTAPPAGAQSGPASGTQSGARSAPSGPRPD